VDELNEEAKKALQAPQQSVIDMLREDRDKYKKWIESWKQEEQLWKEQEQSLLLLADTYKAERDKYKAALDRAVDHYCADLHKCVEVCEHHDKLIEHWMQEL
jgi:hypothetical protein